MSLAIKYETVDDARMRLRGTVVLYKEGPVLVTDVIRDDEGKDAIFRVLFQELPTVPQKAKPFDPFAEDAAKNKKKYISSKYFDIAPFKLGYVNDPVNGAFFCSRLPNRIQKQGLCGENFRGVTNEGVGVPFTNFLMLSETVDMIKGNYPSFDKAVASLVKLPSVAFSREFCLVKDDIIPELIFLYYKGSKVGFVNKQLATLGKKFECLKESLEEMRINVGVA